MKDIGLQKTVVEYKPGILSYVIRSPKIESCPSLSLSSSNAALPAMENKHTYIPMQYI